MKIGWHADVHYSGESTSEKITTPLNYLFGTANCDISIFGGDNTVLDDHVASAQTHVEQFWTAVDATGYGNLCYAIPGNHDVPLTSWFRYSDGRALCPHELLYPGISIYLLNTVGSLGQGNKQTEGSGGRTGIAEMCPYMPLADIRWFEEKATAAHNRGDIILVFCHHHIYFTIDSAATETVTLCLSQKNFYQICRNAHTIYSVLQAVAPVIVLNGHLYNNPSGEGHVEHDSDGVYLVYKDHFSQTPIENRKTFAYIDANVSTGNVKIYTVEPNETENLIFNQTPSW